MLAQGGKVSCMIFCITRQNMGKYFLERVGRDRNGSKINIALISIIDIMCFLNGSCAISEY